MQTITLLLEMQENGQMSIAHYVGGVLAPEIAASACRMIAQQFDQAAIEAEVQRRVEAAQNGETDQEVAAVEEGEE